VQGGGRGVAQVVHLLQAAKAQRWQRHRPARCTTSRGGMPGGCQSCTRSWEGPQAVDVGARSLPAWPGQTRPPPATEPTQTRRRRAGSPASTPRSCQGT
jgi:hypothetical protein